LINSLRITLIVRAIHDDGSRGGAEIVKKKRDIHTMPPVMLSANARLMLAQIHAREASLHITTTRNSYAQILRAHHILDLHGSRTRAQNDHSVCIGAMSRSPNK
jgi:hypothetical protein